MVFWTKAVGSILPAANHKANAVCLRTLFKTCGAVCEVASGVQGPRSSKEPVYRVISGSVAATSVCEEINAVALRLIETVLEPLHCASCR